MAYDKKPNYPSLKKPGVYPPGTDKELGLNSDNLEKFSLGSWEESFSDRSIIIDNPEYPLIQENRPPAKYPSSPKGVTLKPGVMEPKEGPITEDDVNAHEEEKLNYRIDSLRNLQDNVGGELLFLQKKMQDRKRQVNTSLVTNFISSQRRVLPNSHYR